MCVCVCVGGGEYIGDREERREIEKSEKRKREEGR